jgi:uncharacterized protein
MTQGTNFKLVSGHRIAVVSLSANTDRPSFDVARAMQRAGFHIVPVNPRYAGTKILVNPVSALSQKYATQSTSSIVSVGA